jgi:hypothetical protein
MKWLSLLPALIVLAPGLAAASPTATCKTGADGQWVIASYFFDNGIVAVGDAEARKNLGSKVIFSKDQVIFLGDTCHVANVSSEKTKDYPKYPLFVSVGCRNKVTLPYFFVSNSCEKMLAATGDGVYYIMRRQ